ncbi:hypothetical protein SLS60_005841 [Paraconiothyrium brasiliense]|uniref:Uncharacterized protein n=1 Tax=Paraconiothyrium brasiliense TaxID=300254 RepID=A0ABR3RDC2_9PLEO
MAGFPGFNKISSDGDFGTHPEDVMDSKFYGKTSIYDDIHELANKKNNVTVGTLDAAQSGSHVPGGPRDGPVTFGNGNNEKLPFDFDMRSMRFDAAAAATRRTPSFISQAVRKSKDLICSAPGKLFCFPLPSIGFMAPVLGKRKRSAPAPVSGPKECDQASAGCAGKRLRDNNGGSVATAAPAHGPCGENYVQVGRPPHGLAARNPTNTNTTWVRPLRKEYRGVRGFLQPQEDKSWTVDPRTGRRIQTPAH